MAPCCEGELDRQVVEPLGGDARLHMLGQHVEGPGGELPGAQHAFEGVRAVQPDLGVAGLGPGNVEVIHHAGKLSGDLRSCA